MTETRQQIHITILPSDLKVIEKYVEENDSSVSAFLVSCAIDVIKENTILRDTSKDVILSLFKKYKGEIKNTTLVNEAKKYIKDRKEIFTTILALEEKGDIYRRGNNYLLTDGVKHE